MDYDLQIQLNRIEIKLDAIFKKVCPELIPKDGDDEHD